MVDLFYHLLCYIYYFYSIHGFNCQQDLFSQICLQFLWDLQLISSLFIKLSPGRVATYSPVRHSARTESTDHLHHAPVQTKSKTGGGGIVFKYVGTICTLCWALLNVTYKHIVTFLNVMLAVRACFDPTFVFKKIKIQIVYCHLYHKHKQCFIYLRQNVLMNYSRLMNNRNFKNVLILTKLIIMIQENTLSFTQSGNKII